MKSIHKPKKFYVAYSFTVEQWLTSSGQLQIPVIWLVRLERPPNPPHVAMFESIPFESVL